MNTQTMYENWKVSQEQMRTPSSSAGSESWEAEHPESEDPVWLYPGDDGWHEAAPIFVLGFVGDEETDEEEDYCHGSHSPQVTCSSTNVRHYGEPCTAQTISISQKPSRNENLHQRCS